MYRKLSNGSLHVIGRSPVSPNTGGPANSGRRWSYSEHERVVGVNHGPPFHAAKHILSDFRDHFIEDVDANTVQTLEEGRALSEHPLVKGECHMSCSCDSCC